MEGLLIVLVLGVVVSVVIIPFLALARANRALQVAEERFRELSERLRRLEQILERDGPEGISEERLADQRVPSVPESPVPGPPAPDFNFQGIRPRPPLPEDPVVPLVEEVKEEDVEPVGHGPAFRPAASESSAPVDWELFLGARLYAWIGGLALFLAVAFFVKYSFEQGWLPPELRVTAGFFLGLGLLVGGVVLRRREYTIMSQTLSGTGILVLYGVTFACRSIYHFAFFGAVPTFAIMALITGVAFAVAVRLNALVVAVLGLLGGFLTPVLLSTGEDAPLALFSYLALLDVGLLALVWKRRWAVLSPLAATGTVLLFLGWLLRFFEAGSYAEGVRPLIPMGTLLLFNGLWLVAVRLSHRPDREEPLLANTSAGLILFGLLMGLYFQRYPDLTQRPGWLLGYLMLMDFLALALSYFARRVAWVFAMAGVLVFSQLAWWMSTHVTEELLPTALGFTLLFAATHAGWPLVRSRLTGTSERADSWSLFVPPVALGVLLIPAFNLSLSPFWLWPVILLVDFVAVVVALERRSLLPVFASLALTVLATVGSVVRLPNDLSGLLPLLTFIGLFAGLFMASAIWLRRWTGTPAEGGAEALLPLSPQWLAGHVSLAGALPFLLLILMVARLPLSDPSPVFGLALLLTGLLLGLGRMFQIPVLPVVSLGCVAALEVSWHLLRFRSDSPGLALSWYLLFFGVFAVHPFMFRRQVEQVAGPWVAAALAGPVQFYLVHQVVRAAWSNPVMGLLPAAFGLPALVSLLVVRRTSQPDNPTRPAQLALFGGVVLFFFTLIAPLQFSRQWITVSWALEGAALCWLYHRVPHPGLRWTAVGLLLTVFVRLALNPAVLSYHPRSGIPIFNWYLYTYGCAIVAMFVAARLLRPPRDRLFDLSAPALLNTLGVILAFLLLNLQIADFFTEPGQAVLTFQFSGNFARDMSYSIGWALFALVLLVAGMVYQLAATRYAALVLLGVTILKLFLHDLARLATPYRIGALVAVAVVALAASFLYQRFVAKGRDKPRSSTPESPR